MTAAAGAASEPGAGAVRGYDGQGRHTTPSSSPRRLASGTPIIDTPGIRELGLDQLTAEQPLAGFPELAAAGSCRFADCSHPQEPECGVRGAVATGQLASARYASYLRIRSSMET